MNVNNRKAHPIVGDLHLHRTAANDKVASVEHLLLCVEALEANKAITASLARFSIHFVLNKVHIAVGLQLSQVYTLSTN